MKQAHNMTAEDLARAAVAPGYTGGTYAVGITPSAPGGVTFGPHHFVHSRRYAVGGAAFEGARVFAAGRRAEGVVGAITRALVAMAKTTDVIGLWRDVQGRLWIDAVDVYPHAGTALQLALARGELAIWDGIAGEEIPVNPELSRQWAEAREADDDDGPLDPTRAAGLFEPVGDE